MDFQELFGNLSDELDNLVNRLEANVSGILSVWNHTRNLLRVQMKQVLTM